MLELFAVRGQLAITVAIHATLAASTWAASLLAAEGARRSQSQPEWATAAADWWARTRILAPLTTATGLLVAAQVGIFWRNALEVAGGALVLPLVVAVVGSLARAAVVWRSPSVSVAGAGLAVGAGASSGVSALLGLAWLAHPAGASVAVEGTLQASAISAFVSASGWMRVAHVGLAATALGATFFALGAARRKQSRSLGLATRTALAAVTLQMFVGAATVRSVGQHEPVKLAAMAAQWEDRASAPVQIGAWPFDFGEQTRPGLALDGLLSTWVHGSADATVEGLLATPMEGRPPIAAMHVSIQMKVFLGLFAWLTLLGATLGGARGRHPRWLLALTTTPSLSVVWLVGWFVAEMGRSPWTIRGVLRVGKAAWTPYGMAPTAVIPILAALVLAVVALRRCRGLSISTDAPEPDATGNV